MGFEQSNMELFYLVVAFVLCALAAKPLFIGVSATFAFTKGMGGSNRFEKSIDKYNKLQNDGDTSLDSRNANYADLVSQYYDLATEFYEWGWGQSFHFADKRQGARFQFNPVMYKLFPYLLKALEC